MTYILRKDQAERLRQNRAKTGKTAVRQIAEAVSLFGSADKVAGTEEKDETEKSCHLVRFSVEERVNGIGSAAMRRILDMYFRRQDHAAEGRKKPDYSREIAELDKHIKELMEVTVNKRNRELYKLAGGM